MLVWHRRGMESFLPANLRVEADGVLGRIRLDQPAKLNPLSTQTLEELVGAAAWFNDRPEVKCVVVSGEGRAFTAGADLAGFTEGDAGISRAAADVGRRMAEAIEQMEAVTVAAIQGHCVGGGVVLAAACDFRVAERSTRFAIPEVDLGIPLAWGGIQRLVREIGPAATRDLVLTCRPFTADEALGLGFLNRVVDDGTATPAATELAELLATKSTLTLRSTLKAVDAAAEELVSTGTAWSDADSLVNALHDAESREVAAAYLRARGR